MTATTTWRSSTGSASRRTPSQRFAHFTTREVEQGTRFHYASDQTVALTLLMRAVTGTTLSEYLTQRLWQPMGAEADATWIRTRDGTESGGGNFNAILRDYGRLGILLANDGAVGGKQIIPREYLLEATDWRRQPEAFAPRQATPFFGYGYQFWLFPGEKRRFALLGVYGQSIFVDPELKLVMVITAAAEMRALERSRSPPSAARSGAGSSPNMEAGSARPPTRLIPPSRWAASRHVAAYDLLRFRGHFHLGFAFPDAQLRQACDKRLCVLCVFDGDAAFVEILGGDTRLLE